MRMVQVAFHQVVYVVAMGNRRMAAAGTVNVPFRVACARVLGRALFRVRGIDFQSMLGHLAARFWMVQVAIVQIVDVSLVLHGRMAAVFPVLMFVGLRSVA